MEMHGLLISVFIVWTGKFLVEANSFEPQLVENGQNVLKVAVEDYVYGYWGYYYYNYFYYNQGNKIYCDHYGYYYSYGRYYYRKWRCKRITYKYKCMVGYRSLGLDHCPYAICEGQTNPTGACNQYATVSTKFGWKGNYSSGSCISPENCNNCNIYFYNDGPRCTVCPNIANCIEMHCYDTAASTICANCEGVVRDAPFYRAYVRSDNKKQCLQACSWRSDSTRCYPGYCEGELAANCRCVQGFNGTHCEKMTEQANIVSNWFNLRHKHDVLNNPSGSVDAGPHPIVWSNYGGWNLAETVWNAQYVIKERLNTNSSHYIKAFVYGIIGASTVLNFTQNVLEPVKTYFNRTESTNDTQFLNQTLVAGNMSSVENTTTFTDFNITLVPKTIEVIEKYLCPKASKSKPSTSSFECKKNFSLESGSVPFNFSTGDTMTFTIEADIGGYLIMENREKGVNETHNLIGTTKTLQYIFRWDFVLPYHCVENETNPENCKDPLTVPDLTENSEVTITWCDWFDDLAGLQKYIYQIHTVSNRNNILKEDGPLQDGGTGTIYVNETFKEISFPGTGLYSVHLTAYDKAGNYKSTRRLVLYDSNSHVSHNPYEHTRVETGSKDTNHTWVIDNTTTIEVTWTKRFRNALHDHNKWLNEVSQSHGISDLYDDFTGKMTVKNFKNVYGCVDFMVGFSVYDGTGVKDFQPLISVHDIFTESETLTLNWSDGDKAELTVVAVDIFNKTLNDTLVVYKDATPPVIENLWLTRGNRLNISVHRLEDFTEMTIEWLAYDYHSGIDSIYWRLFDNFTGENILHGHEDLFAQGSSQDLNDCISKYGSYSRGPNCYETNHWGAFHRHYQIKPEIKRDGGLVHGKDLGLHDSDYFLEVKATNKAVLSTVLTRKITIDISPPHTGTVQDGIKGTDEVDFQQSKTISAHWDGFFDKESGVMFYMYGFSTAHILASDFQLDSNSSIIKETYTLHATHTVTSEGTYYACVVAYNRALEPSDPVCSDGVTVTTYVPSVSEVDISSAHVREGLVTDTGQTNYWVVGTNRHRRLIENPTSDCVNKAVPLSNVDIFPVDYHKNGSTVQVDGSVFCNKTMSSRSISSPVLSKSSYIKLSWLSNETFIHDYEVGIATVAGSPAPDIRAYTSSTQHRHIFFMHSDLPEGTPFYFVVKTISKSNTIGIQSIGPCFLDTTPPTFTPPLIVSHESGFLVVTWNVGTFVDPDDPFPLNLQVAMGHTPRGMQVQEYSPIQSGASCGLTVPPTCTTIRMSDTEWSIHGNHTYYVTVKAENAAGLTTYGVSEPYVHDVQLPTTGIVMDVLNDVDNRFIDIEDIDFKSENHSLSARWTGFYHAFVDVTYQFRAGTSPGAPDVVQNKDVGKNESHTENGLSLTLFSTYFITITAKSSAGSVEVISDGITVVKENAILNGVTVFDGEPCNETGVNSSTMFNHHDWVIQRNCSKDADYQSSTDTLSGYWVIPDNLAPFTPDEYFAIEQKSLYGDDWSTFKNYTYNHGHRQAHVTGLLLDPGRLYRFVVKLCARETCYHPVHSNGILILANPPTTGALDVQHDNTTVPEKLVVVLDMFADPDIQIPQEKYGVVDKYEWAITDQSELGRLHTRWHELKNHGIIPNRQKMEFSIILDGKFDFSKCRKLTIRGYNKAGLYSTVSAEIKDCSAFDPVLINPNIVIDAVGSPDPSKDGYGEAILLQTNARWPYPDMDYTPNMNYISAVWPTLRYNSYTVAVIKAQNLDVTTYYLPSNTLSLSDPCSYPDAIKCETTEHEFINVKFNDGELEHGQRYIVCIHTQYTEIHHEKWTQVLPEINTCSDGIRVDLTSPFPGNVWIGRYGQRYQISATDMYISWESFKDIEEFQTMSHSSGIQSYSLGIGTSFGGNDVVAFFDVGVVNHKVIHGLTLHSGHTYYATVKATDFANRTTSQTSGPVTVDTTPPIKSDDPITIQGRHITSTSELEACWKGVFRDPESDIDYFMWSVGSQPGHSDIMEFVRENNECGSYDENHRLDFKEGHPYYISVKAYNKANLMALATSWAYIVDLTAPFKGHVFDVLPSGDNKVDIDYQIDMSRLKVGWSGFYDPHSSIKEYFISIGTCSSCDDVIGVQSVGIVNEIEVDYIHIGSGLTYFTEVTACNTADLCTSVVSDGVTIDNSPPNVGVVTDGTSSDDVEYQSITTWIGAKWYDFTDPESGISHYVWWAGTTPGGSDILSETEVHLVEEATAYNFSKRLPETKRIFVTVRAYNKAGLFADSTSSGFLVDTTAPDISSGPKFTRDFGLVENTQFYRTSVKVEWKVEDLESHIERQYLSLRSHLGGDFELSSTRVNGIARDFILTDLKLHDGVTYYVTLVSCNGAQLCSTAASSGILVDSSPPNRGTFAVQTDHAVDKDLSRHVSGFMTWWKYAINLAWLGFSDAHSDITHYFINVGSTYMGSDLNSDATFPKRVNHSSFGKDSNDEGKIQTYAIPTQKLVTYDFLYISVWAVNRVGLSSAIVHSKFKKLPQGILSLVRRCKSEDCEGQCVCAPQDKVCHNNGSSCSDVTIGNPNNLLKVSDIMFGTSDVQFIPSNTVLQGRWSIVHRQGRQPFMYQWSVGFTDQDVPAGIFDPEHDRVWHDAGQQNFVVYTTKQGQLLEEAVSYSVFVKAWYDKNTYAVFKSNGVIIDTKRPAVVNILGSSVTEKMIIGSMKDDDYIKEGVSLMVNWTNKFANDRTTIKHYHVYISTVPGGHDIWDNGELLPNTETTYLVRSLSFSPGVKYFVNVIAYGFSDIHHTESSDGFVIDNMKPKAGIVFDGIGLHDLEYQNSSNTIGAHWHGFSDTASGVKNYFWCVGNTTSAWECNTRSWEDIGIDTSVSRTLSDMLSIGKVYYNKVYTTDNVGYKSEVAVSDGVTIDVTPPQPEYLFHTENNLLRNPSFETHQNSLSMENVQLINICALTTDFLPDFWSLTSESCATVISSKKNLARDGRSSLFIRGSVKQVLDGLKLGGLYRVEFFSSQVPVKTASISNKEGFISVGKSKHVFLLYSKAYRHDEHETSLSREIVSWHRHTFYFTATTVKSDFEIGSTDAKTGIFLDQLSIRHVEKSLNNSANAHVSAHIVYVHQWGSIHASWSFFEDFSPITVYNWAIGYTKGGTQIQRFTSAGIKNFGYNSNVTLIHNTYVHVTVTATNTAELVGISYSDPIHVDLTPPDILYVYDGRLLRGDEDAWTDNEVAVNFMAKDDESGIEYCEWAVGYQAYGSDLQMFERLAATDTPAFRDFDYSVLENQTIYSTIRCHNRAGLFSLKSSDGVKISIYPPATTNTEITIIPLSITEYQAGRHYQSYTNNVRIQWSGFEDFTGIEQFKITFTDEKSTSEEKMSFPIGQDIQSASIMNLNMPEGLQNITLQAISKLLLTSEKILYNLTAVHSKPTKRDGSKIMHSWHAGNKEFTLTWNDIFVSKYPLFYEVSVGTVEGGSDILQWQETTGTSITFGLPPTISNGSNLSLHVFVRAICAGGTYEDIKFVINKK